MNYCMECFEELQTGAATPCPYCNFDESAYEQLSHRLPLRTVLYGKYMIGRVLGEGGFGHRRHGHKPTALHPSF